MQFQRLRLAGFKSFVDVCEFRIEPGLTGVVGPNGCGKSNLLEALRWVMGASSAKALRAGGMDDVIFGGSSARPSRNHAEVRLEIDNTDRRAPARFNDHAVLEVVRRIDRGAGSSYRVNGVEQRARDVQLLFADASTGANSPALVRQGQISELIAAKPANRRRILEEAAGVSGLHSRRHEADLRLKAAEANLDRLDDVARELEGALNRLKREAKQAEKYKRLSADIRTLKGAVLYARWREAAAALEAAREAGRAAETAVAATAAEAARTSTTAAQASAALPPLREEVQVAAAIWQRLTIEADRVEREAAQAEAEVARLRTERARIAADLAREAETGRDAGATSARLEKELAELDAHLAAAPERLPALTEALRWAEAARAEADVAVEAAAGEVAAEAAVRHAALAGLDHAQAAQRAAAGRRADDAARRDRLAMALAAAKAERAALGPLAPDANSARARLDAAVAALGRARSALEAADAARGLAQAAETEAREAARRLEDRLGPLKAEAQGLAQLLRSGRKGAHAPALEQVSPAPGYEAALAAALGDELDAALDPAAPAHWAGAAAIPTAWPDGAEPLADKIQAPGALAARLALIAVVARADGERLRGVVPVGARLVSREGDLWRWDGFTVRADAPRPAALRLAQRNRLAEVEAALSALLPQVEAAATVRRAAADRLRQAEDAFKANRQAPAVAEQAVAAARDEAERHAREAARQETRAAALDETLERLGAETADAGAALAAAADDLALAERALADARAAAPATSEAASPGTGRLQTARAAAGQAREGETRARAALDAERRAREGRTRRREAASGELAQWRRRAEGAGARVEALERNASTADAALAAASARPGEAAGRRERVLGELQTAEARRARAADALARAETALADADRAARAADHAAGEAREARAAWTARIEAAEAGLLAAAEQVREGVRMEPEALGRAVAGQAVPVPTDPAAVEGHLAAMERERDQLGAVNLRAEEEAAELSARVDEMRRERADLTGAIAKLRAGVEALNAEGRERLLAAFEVIDGHFRTLFHTLFEGGQAELRLVEADDPLEAGLEIFACPPGKRLAAMSLMSGGEQALTAAALIFAVFLANPAPVCVLDEVDAPLDDANVDRFCRMLDEMRRLTETRFIAITHNPVTMSRMDRLYGVTMPEPGVSQLVSIDLRQAEALAAE